MNCDLSFMLPDKDSVIAEQFQIIISVCVRAVALRGYGTDDPTLDQQGSLEG